MKRVVLKKLVGTVCAVAAMSVLGSSAAMAQHKARLGNPLPLEHPQSTTLEHFAKLADTYTKGKVQIKVYHGAVLGGDDKMLQATQAGTQDMYYGSISPISGRVKELQIFDFPFMFNNMEEVDAVFHGEVGQLLAKKLEPLNLVTLGWGEVGFRQLSNSKRPINKAEDIAGLKIRVMQSQVAVASWKDMGANAVPMSFAEVFTALETKALDGQENPLIHMYANKMYEVQKYITVTNHVYTPAALVVSSRFWKKLNAEEQAGLRRAADESMKFHRDIMTKADVDVVKKLREYGVEVAPLPPAELDKLRAKVKPTIEKFTPVVGADFAKAYTAAIESVRNKK